MKHYIIRDWAGNWLEFVFKNARIDRFDSWDDAEEFLSERLGDEYENDRGEYYIEELIDQTKVKRYLDPNDPRQ